MIRILAGDPSPVFRAGIKCVLGCCPDLSVAGEASDYCELLQLTRVTACDVVTIEIAGFKNSWVDFIGQLQAARHSAAVLVVSALPESVYGRHALRAGAAGYLGKECSRDQLIEAVKTVAGGKRYVSRSLAETLAGMLAGNCHGRHCERLSTRELQVLRLLAEGSSVGQIAERISLSVKTVSTYRSRILEKTHLHNNAELMRYALLENLV